MSWLFSLFSSRNSSDSRKVMSSTHESFSLPTSSPLSPHPDAFIPDSLNRPDRDFASPTSYSYPPISPGGSYDYVPASSRSRQSTLLPLHSTPFSQSSPMSHYPPLSQTWQRLRTWLSREYPELGDTLNWGILPEDLALIEMQFGFALPPPVRDSYLMTNGQEPESSAGCSEGLFFGLTLLPLEDVLEEWRFWREVDEDPATGANVRLRDLMQSIPPGWIRREYSLRGWIPLVTDKGGNYLGVDMNPAENGAPGQVIVFGRDFDTKVVLWRGDGTGGWAKWLASFADDLESGEGFEMGVSEGSEGSEDDIGYESYFYDGSGRGSGDGGGDSGTGGMRLTGVYKGWNTLEALADRSLRKWHEEGVLPNLPDAPESMKYSDKMTLATFDLSAVGNGSAAEVPIPVMAQTDESSPPLEVVTTEAHNRIDIPTISITKPHPPPPPPPAPLPVNLPTEHDLPIPDPYHHGPDDDVEIGQGLMREIDSELESVSVKPRPPSNTSPAQNPPYNEDAVLVSLPLNPPQPLPSPSHQEIDLLTDEEVILEMPSLAESGSKESRLPDESTIPETHPKHVADANGIPNKEQDMMIRLVGGGGTQGLIDDDEDKVDDSDGELVEVQPVSSVIYNDSTAETSSKHEKKRSSISSGLKKFGNIGGGKRKKATSAGTEHEVE